MRDSTTNTVAIIFDDLTEFFVMQPAIDAMQKAHIKVDIIIPYDSGYNGLAKHTLQTIKNLGYSPKKDATKAKTYQILLTPYPGLEIVKRTNFTYHIQYFYGAISSKPNPAYAPSYHIEYDAILSFNTYDQFFLDACGSKVYTLPYWRYHNFKKHVQNSSKPNLLFLPTFGSDTSCINDFTGSTISELKKHYHVIAKAHHATHFAIDNDDSLKKLQKISDEFYDSDTPIDKLLEQADLTLSDNSGAIFESICAGVPTALFTKNLNSRHFGKINTPQYKFAKQGFFPHAKTPAELLPALMSTQKYVKKQQELRKQLFLELPKDPIKPFLNIINHYLSLNPDQDYHKILHSTLVHEYQEYKQTISAQTKEIQKLKQQITDIHSSTSWKVTKPFRNIKSWSQNHVQK